MPESGGEAISICSAIFCSENKPHKIRNYTKVKYLLFEMEWRFFFCSRFSRISLAAVAAVKCRILV